MSLASLSWYVSKIDQCCDKYFQCVCLLLIAAQYVMHNLGAKCLLSVCISFAVGFCLWSCSCWHPNANKWNIIRQVINVWFENYLKQVNKIKFHYECSVRGALNSLFDPFNNIGIILSFFLGNYLSCLDQAKLQLIVPAIFLIVMFFIPETPEYWAKRNNAKVFGIWDDISVKSNFNSNIWLRFIHTDLFVCFFFIKLKQQFIFSEQ